MLLFFDIGGFNLSHMSVSHPDNCQTPVCLSFYFKMIQYLEEQELVTVPQGKCGDKISQLFH